MRGSLRGFLAAAAVVGFAALGSAPAGAASPLRLAMPSSESPIISVQFDGGRHGDSHNSFREEQQEGIGRFSPHRRYHNRRHFRPRAFYFGFPFAFAPPYYPYNRHRDCYRTWDGQLFCRY